MLTSIYHSWPRPAGFYWNVLQWCPPLSSHAYRIQTYYFPWQVSHLTMRCDSETKVIFLNLNCKSRDAIQTELKKSLKEKLGVLNYYTMWLLKCVLVNYISYSKLWKKDAVVLLSPPVVITCGRCEDAVVLLCPPRFTLNFPVSTY